MVVEMRQLDRIKDKISIRLDNRQIGWLLLFGLVAFGCVFAAGYYVGGQSPTKAPPAVAVAPALASSPEAAAAEPETPEAVEEEASAEPLPAPKYTYDEVLTAPTPPVQLDDPALKLLAEAGSRNLARAGGDLDLAGPRPAPGEATGEAVQRSPDDDGVATALERALDDPKAAAAHPVARPVKAAAPAKARLHGTAQAVEAEANATGYTIQVKAFRERKEAKKFLSALKEAGYKPYLLSADVPNKGRFYRIRLGKFKSMDEAASRQAAFEKAEGFKTIVTPL